MNNYAASFLGVLGCQMADISGEVREVSFFFQLMQRFNTVLLDDSFVDKEAGTGIPA